LVKAEPLSSGTCGESKARKIRCHIRIRTPGISSFRDRIQELSQQLAVDLGTYMKIRSVIFSAAIITALAAFTFASDALAQGTWTTIAPMPTAVLQASGVAMGGKFYVIDGYDSAGTWPSAHPQVYDPIANSWSFKAADPVPRAEVAAGVINNKIYVAEGWINSDSNNPTSALEIYDPATDSWTAGAPSLVARGWSATAVIGGKIYITGGTTYWQNPGIATLEIYDPNINTWSTGAPIPVAPKGAVGAALNGKFYIVGGGAGGNPFLATANVYIYDPTSNTWTSGVPMPSPRMFAAGGVINGKLYITGGSSADGTDNPVVVYDPITDSWSAAAAEPTPRNAAAAAAVGCKLFVAGGSSANGGPFTSTAESYTPECGGCVGPQGQKGDKGDTGAQGAKGDPGATGFTGPQGEVGPQGPNGDTGAQGPAGPPANFGSLAATSVLFADSNGAVTTNPGQFKLLNYLSSKNAELSLGGNPVQEGYNFVGYGGVGGPYGGPGMLLKTAEDDQQSTVVLQAGSNQLEIQRVGPFRAGGFGGFPYLPDTSFLWDTGNGLILYAPGNASGVNGKLIFATGTNGDGSEKMRLDPNGNLGIGTTTPAASLDVNGNVAIAGNVVIDANGNWVGNPTGLTGPQGAKGDTGATGAIGPQGSTGDTGAKGDTGAQGPSGPKGDTGSTGPKGDTGTAGPQGPQGVPGPNGTAGPQGPQGVPGPAGATGPQGPAGIGLVSGAYLELSSGTTAPAGFTKIGTSSLQFKDLTGKNQNVAVDVYRKN
jgi:hypothetical protein